MAKTYSSSDQVTIVTEEILAESAKAYLCRFRGGEEIWLAKSQIDCAAEVHDKNEEISAPFWIVENDDLEDYLAD